MPNRRKRVGEAAAAAGAKSDFRHLPEDIIIEILSRLPVKSLLRCKCVSKPWRDLILNPSFVSSHLNRATANHPTATVGSLIVSFKKCMSSADTLLLLDYKNPPDVDVVVLDHSFPINTGLFNLVGSINGLVCLSLFNNHRHILLWNPAIKEYMYLNRPSIKIRGQNYQSSLGFCFDSVTSDYKVVRIVFPYGRVEVYSAIAHCWREIEEGFPFDFTLCYSCDVIVNGVPYWLASEKREVGIVKLPLVLISFDVKNEVFRQLPVLNPDQSYPDPECMVVNWENSIAVLVCYPAGSGFVESCVDVWMIDDGHECESDWNKKFVIGPIYDVACLVGCTKNGEILIETDVAWGGIFLHDAQNGGSKVVPVDGALVRSLKALDYVETLVSIEGFTRKRVTRKRGKSNWLRQPSTSEGDY